MPDRRQEFFTFVHLPHRRASGRWVLSKSFQLSANPLPPIGPPCVTASETTTRESVPHYLPEKNPFLDEMTTRYKVPREAVLGYRETLYPEYRKTMIPR
jgi:hypothetical protein